MILIADDDRTSRALLSDIITERGHRALEATDGRQAWELIDRHGPPVAILALGMPVDGIDLCRRIRQAPRFASMHVLLVTHGATNVQVCRVLDAGADDYLRKPFDTNELRARLNVASRIAKVSFERDQLLASLSSILIGLDADGRITRWNSVAQRTFGVSANQVIGRSLADCGIRWSDPERLEGLLGDHAGDEAVHYDLSFCVDGERPRLVGMTITTMSLGGGQRPGRVLLGTEITERRMLEIQLRQAQKLEGIGQLAAGIAHEINTPMQYIGDNVRFLRDSMAGLNDLLSTVMTLADPPAAMSDESRAAVLATLAEQAASADLAFLREHFPDAVTQSLEGVERVSKIVRAMKEFAHPDGGEKEFVDLNHAIETTLLVARNELKYVADVRVELEPNLPRIPCLAGEVNQVFLNLFINAAHAIAEANTGHPEARGTIQVSTHSLGAEVEIRVSDTGAGIPEPIRTRVFEPFFTTKDVGQGTGQGLAMAYATIVGRHNGRIWFDTALGAGTTFFVRLPLALTRQQGAVA